MSTEVSITIPDGAACFVGGTNVEDGETHTFTASGDFQIIVTLEFGSQAVAHPWIINGEANTSLSGNSIAFSDLDTSEPSVTIEYRLIPKVIFEILAFCPRKDPSLLYSGSKADPDASNASYFGALDLSSDQPSIMARERYKVTEHTRRWNFIRFSESPTGADWTTSGESPHLAPHPLVSDTWIDGTSENESVDGVGDYTSAINLSEANGNVRVGAIFVHTDDMDLLSGSPEGQALLDPRQKIDFDTIEKVYYKSSLNASPLLLQQLRFNQTTIWTYVQEKVTLTLIAIHYEEETPVLGGAGWFFGQGEHVPNYGHPLFTKARTDYEFVRWQDVNGNQIMSIEDSFANSTGFYLFEDTTIYALFKLIGEVSPPWGYTGGVIDPDTGGGDPDTGGGDPDTGGGGDPEPEPELLEQVITFDDVTKLSTDDSFELVASSTSGLTDFSYEVIGGTSPVTSADSGSAQLLGTGNRTCYPLGGGNTIVRVTQAGNATYHPAFAEATITIEKVAGSSLLQFCETDATLLTTFIGWEVDELIRIYSSVGLTTEQRQLLLDSVWTCDSASVEIEQEDTLRGDRLIRSITTRSRGTFTITLTTPESPKYLEVVDQFSITVAGLSSSMGIAQKTSPTDCRVGESFTFNHFLKNQTGQEVELEVLNLDYEAYVIDSDLNGYYEGGGSWNYGEGTVPVNSKSKYEFGKSHYTLAGFYEGRTLMHDTYPVTSGGTVIVIESYAVREPASAVIINNKVHIIGEGAFGLTGTAFANDRYEEKNLFATNNLLGDYSVGTKTDQWIVNHDFWQYGSGEDSLEFNQVFGYDLHFADFDAVFQPVNPIGTTHALNLYSVIGIGASNTNKTNLPLTFTSSHTNRCTVSSSGLITITGPGEATITVSQAGNYAYNPAVTRTISIFIAGTPAIEGGQMFAYGSQLRHYSEPHSFYGQYNEDSSVSSLNYAPGEPGFMYIPDGITEVHYRMWGGGGGSGARYINSADNSPSWNLPIPGGGGAGAYAEGTIDVSSLPSDQYYSGQPRRLKYHVGAPGNGGSFSNSHGSGITGTVRYDWSDLHTGDGFPSELAWDGIPFSRMLGAGRNGATTLSFLRHGEGSDGYGTILYYGSDHELFIKAGGGVGGVGNVSESFFSTYGHLSGTPFGSGGQLSSNDPSWEASLAPGFGNGGSGGFASTSPWQGGTNTEGAVAPTGNGITARGTGYGQGGGTNGWNVGTRGQRGAILIWWGDHTPVLPDNQHSYVGEVGTMGRQMIRNAETEEWEYK